MSPRINIRQGQSAHMVSTDTATADQLVQDMRNGRWVQLNTPNGTAHINGATVDSIEVERD